MNTRQGTSAATRNFQKHLLQDRERYRLALEATNDCIFEYSIPTDTLRSFQTVHTPSENAPAASLESQPDHLERYELSQFRSRVGHEDFAHPDDAAEVEACICDGAINTKSFRLRRSPDPAGQYNWYTIHNRIIFEQGKPVRVVGTMRNVEQQELLARIVERFVYYNCDYFVLINAKTNSFTTFNATAHGSPVPPAFGTDYTQAAINFVAAHVRPEFRKQTLENLNLDVVLAELDAHGEFSFFSGDTDPLRGPTHNKVTFVYYDKEALQILLIHTDVTHIFNEEARKRAELREALQLAREASNAKTEFLSRMSHDLRTPLNAIMGMTAIAKLKLNAGPSGNSSQPENADGAEHAKPAAELKNLLACRTDIAECLEKIDVSSRYLLTLLNSILNLSRLDSEQVKLASDPLCLSSFINDISALFLPQAEAGGLDFQVQLDPELPQLFATDRSHLEQVLLNLLSNALKFTPEGGHIQLNISLLPRAAENSNSTLALAAQNTVLVEFCISDSGIGISPEFLPKAFDPFEQEYADYARNRVGTGLGLPIVKSIVQLMHGSVYLESEGHLGCKAVVHVPLAVLQSNEVMMAQELAQPTLQTPPCAAAKLFHGQTILLVEDNEINQEIAQVLLESEGLRVDIAEHGKIALDKFNSAKSGHYSAILMDIRMPVMDGLAATQAIRALPRQDAVTIPIIALTANAFQDDMDQALAAGMNFYLTKPADPTLLYGTLKNFIG